MREHNRTMNERSLLRLNCYSDGWNSYKLTSIQYYKANAFVELSYQIFSHITNNVGSIFLKECRESETKPTKPSTPSIILNHFNPCLLIVNSVRLSVLFINTQWWHPCISTIAIIVLVHCQQWIKHNCNYVSYYNYN